jgi:serine/threonine protein phosphatase PrpC
MVRDGSRSSGMPPSFTSAQALALVREAGQDRLTVLRREDALIVVVADGVGGISGGAAAAEILVKLVEEAVLVPGFHLLRSEAWVELLTRADLVLEADPRAGETTGVVIAVSEQGLVVGASCGDSGAWMLGEDGSVDDLTACQHRKLRLGSGRARPVFFLRPKLQGTLLVATDGLFNYARPERIAELVLGDDLDLAVKKLVKLVRLPSGRLQDDVGVMLLRSVD